MSSEKGKAGFWWPDVATIEQARSAAMGGATAAIIVSVITMLFTLYAVYHGPLLNLSAWSFFDAGAFALIAFGIWRLSRVAAVIGLLLYLIEQGYQWASVGPKNPVMAILFILFFIGGIRGTFSHYKLRKAAAEAQPGVQADRP